jgi:hypothetical protein
MTDHEIRLQKLEAEVESMRMTIRELLADLQERKEIYALVKGRLN